MVQWALHAADVAERLHAVQVEMQSNHAGLRSVLEQYEASEYAHQHCPLRDFGTQLSLSFRLFLIFFLSCALLLLLCPFSVSVPQQVPALSTENPASDAIRYANYC
jgi:hypothetical protein